MKIKEELLKFILYVYNTHIEEDWSVITKFGKIFLYIPWFIRSTIIWIFSFLLIPEYMFKQTPLYKDLKKNLKF